MPHNVISLLGTVQPNLFALVLAALIPVGVLTVLVMLAATVAIFGGTERGERARLVLCNLLEVLGRGGRQ
ncbi:hypothetical protein [Nocardia sp. bgisy118]|uniref:hypothetical protein n=1 Tax=Nocardia sp. bgisy118 TaxID=3413786 RepID=UPI003F4A3431